MFVGAWLNSSDVSRAGSGSYCVRVRYARSTRRVNPAAARNSSSIGSVVANRIWASGDLPFVEQVGDGHHQVAEPRAV